MLESEAGGQPIQRAQTTAGGLCLWRAGEGENLDLNLINHLEQLHYTMTTYEKLVEGATKIKLAPPKPKYVEPILIATANGEKNEDFRTIMKALDKRLQSSVWTMVYKSLVVLHIMLREGDDHTTIKYLASHLKMLDITIGKNGRFISNGGDLKQIYSYASYLATRAKEYRSTGHDFIRETKKPYGSWDSHDKTTVLRVLSVDKGLLRETESVQRQIDALLQCNFNEREVNNDLIVLSFRMLTTDLVSLYQCLNEGVLNILEHFFDLSKPDALRAYEIYDYFTKQTRDVIDFLRIAKHLESVTKLKVPTIKHAQTSLSNSLREYLDDPAFEVNRRQYLAEKRYSKIDNKKESINDNKVEKQKVVESGKSDSQENQQFQQQPPEPQFVVDQQQALAFQQQLLQQQMLQQQALQAQATQNAILEQQLAQQSVQQQMLNAQLAQSGFQGQTTGFNPFTSNMNSFSVQPQQVPQPQPQSQIQIPPPQAATFIVNPLQPARSLSHNFTGNGFGNIINNNATGQSTGNVVNSNFASPIRKSSKNPFSNSRFSSGSNTSAFTSNEDTLQQSPIMGSLKPSNTGTNPFRLETNIQPSQSLTTVSEFKPQVTAGGLERLPTIPVFPETKRELYQQDLQFNAGVALSNGVLQQQVANNPFTAQATGLVQQAQMQQPQQQQQQQTYQYGHVQQPLQQQMYSNVYNGPNLLG